MEVVVPKGLVSVEALKVLDGPVSTKELEGLNELLSVEVLVTSEFVPEEALDKTLELDGIKVVVEP